MKVHWNPPLLVEHKKLILQVIHTGGISRRYIHSTSDFLKFLNKLCRTSMFDLANRRLPHRSCLIYMLNFSMTCTSADSITARKCMYTNLKHHKYHVQELWLTCQQQRTVCGSVFLIYGTILKPRHRMRTSISSAVITTAL